MPPDLNSPVSLTTVCGSSSMLVHVTVDPVLTVKGVGLNMKSLTTIFAGSEVSAIDGRYTSIAPKIKIPTAVSSNWVRRTFTLILLEYWMRVHECADRFRRGVLG